MQEWVFGMNTTRILDENLMHRLQLPDEMLGQGFCRRYTNCYYKLKYIGYLEFDVSTDIRSKNMCCPNQNGSYAFQTKHLNE